MVIRILNFVSGANTSEEGFCIYGEIERALSANGTIEVSFDGVQTATSSFVHAAFVELLNRFSYADLKARLRVTNSTRQINDMIKTRLVRSANVAA